MAEKEYIERGALIEKMFPIGIPNDGAYPINAKAVRVAIEQALTADVVEVRHEKWVNNHCTGCGMMPLGEEIWTRLGLTPPKFEWFMDFCPICGAKMDGERKADNE